MPTSSSYRLETISIHAGQANDPFTGAVIAPIYQTTTFAQDELLETSSPEWCYTRSGNPTRTALEANLAALEGGRFGLAFSSGLAAANAVLQTLAGRPVHLVTYDTGMAMRAHKAGLKDIKLKQEPEKEEAKHPRQPKQKAADRPEWSWASGWVRPPPGERLVCRRAAAR